MINKAIKTSFHNAVGPFARISRLESECISTVSYNCQLQQLAGCQLTSLIGF